MPNFRDWCMFKVRKRRQLVGMCAHYLQARLRWWECFSCSRERLSEGFLLIVEVCHYIFSSHLHIFTSHPLIFTSSHLLTSSHVILTSSHLLMSSSHLHIFTSHPHIFTSSHLHIFLSSHLLTSSHLQIFHLLPSCFRLALLPSCPLFLFSISLLRRGAVPTRHHETQPFRTKWSSISRN